MRWAMRSYGRPGGEGLAGGRPHRQRLGCQNNIQVFSHASADDMQTDQANGWGDSGGSRSSGIVAMQCNVMSTLRTSAT